MQPTEDDRPDPIDALVDSGRRRGPGDEPLGSFLAALREDAAVTVASPGPSLVIVLTNGLPAPGAVAPAAPTGSTWRRRMSVAGRVLVTKFAALGLLAKAATAGAAVTIAASGAGAAGVLPAPAQEAFDVVVGRDAPAGPGEESPAVATDDDTTIESPEGGVGPTTEGDSVSVVDDDRPGVDEDAPGVDEDRPGEDEPGAFGERVSGDATGETDGVPGVDGREVASEASDGRSEQRGASGEARDRRRGDAGATDPTADASDTDADAEPEDGASVGDDTDRGDTGNGDATDGDAADGDAADAPVAGGGAGNGGADDRGRGVGPPPGAPANGRGG